MYIYIIYIYIYRYIYIYIYIADIYNIYNRYIKKYIYRERKRQKYISGHK